VTRLICLILLGCAAPQSKGGMTAEEQAWIAASKDDLVMLQALADDAGEAR
jgi:hypothetical protein